MWAQAKRIAKDTLDGKIWLAEIGHATHYHAYWVHPSWVHEMTKLYKLGVHTFYRPRAWGNGNDEPIWGTPARPRSRRKPTEAARRRGERGPKHDGPCRSSSRKDALTREAVMTELHISISSPMSRFCTEWVSAPEER